MKNHGFELKETNFVKEINANVNMYLHQKTGARLLHIDAEDTNKVFSIAFRTPPENSTGVAHIVEHSVLCGSEKYPSKEPFVELLKGSLYTFLNAMTGLDYTVYPVASTNDKDFKTLAEVYLDAVFFPNMLKIDDIFFQEGWHFDMEKDVDELTYKGVVYNEMRGAYSDPSDIFTQKLTEIIYPDNAYKHCSGGKPECIPDLSLEDFRAFHKKYYHPSNSYFYLYGKMNIEEMFTLINDEALDRFEKTNIESAISPQSRFSEPIETEYFYPISEEDDEKDKTWFGLNFLIDFVKSTDSQISSPNSLYFSFKVISHLLLQTPAAPLKNALLKAGICQDVYGGFETDTLQPHFYIVMKNSNLEHKEKFKEIVFHTLRDLCEKGIDKQLIEASICIKEFNLREAEMGHFPKGMAYLIYTLSDWIHDKDPIKNLCYHDVLEDTKASLKTNLYETLIQKYILENKHYAFLTMKPVKGLAEKNHEVLKTKLAEKKESLNKSEIDTIVQTTNNLIKRQMAPDAKEDIEKIPVLELNDIDSQAEDFAFNQKLDMNTRIMFLEHDDFTNGIVYLKLYFNAISIPQHLLQYVKAMTYILGRIKTKKYDLVELSNLKNIHTGGINFGLVNFESYRIEDRFEPYFIVASKAMLSKTQTMIELISEILQNTLFEDAARLKEILNEHKSHTEMMLMQAGHYFAETRLKAYISNAGKFNETVDGVEFYFFLKELVANFEKNSDTIIKNFYEAYQILFNSLGLHVSITAPKNDIIQVKDKLQILTSNLNRKSIKPIKYSFDFNQKNEAFVLPGMVQYVAKGYSFKKLLLPSFNDTIYKQYYHGDMQVLDNLVELDYMWNKIRVKGGAYGAMFNISYNGMMIANSYRDPNLKESLKIYDELPEYLNNLEMDNKEFVKYIIGAIRKFDIPKTPVVKSQIADNYYFIEKHSLALQEQRYQILSADFIKIRMYSIILEEIMKMNYFCVFGSETKIKENGELFSRIVPVFARGSRDM